MWILNKITTKDGLTFDQCFMRLAPDKEYSLRSKTNKHSDCIQMIKVGPFSDKAVLDPRFRPDLLLIQRNCEESIIVDNQATESEHHLHDTSLIRYVKSNTLFRIRWEEVIIYVDPNDTAMTVKLVNSAMRDGFHVVHKYTKAVSHFYIDTDDYKDSDRTIDLAYCLADRKFVVNSEWVNNLITSIDNKFNINELNKTIKTVVQEDFGFLKRNAILGYDKRRSTLFEGFDFYFFEKQQLLQVEELIRKCRGTAVLKDLETYDTSTPIPPLALFVVPNETANHDKWIQLQSRLSTILDSLRIIILTEIPYAVVYASTNLACNPSANILQYISSSDPIYQSVQAASFTGSSFSHDENVYIKQEEIESDLPQVKIKEEEVHVDSLAVLSQPSESAISIDSPSLQIISPSSMEPASRPPLDTPEPVSQEEEEREDDNNKDVNDNVTSDKDADNSDADNNDTNNNDADDNAIDNNGNDNNTKRSNLDEEEGAYIKVVYAPLVVNPNPIVRSNNTNTGVNYKRFKKVHHKFPEMYTNFISFSTQSQIVNERAPLRNQRGRDGFATAGRRIEDTDDFDRDIAIRSIRRR